MKTNQTGFISTELLLGLAIFALLSASAAAMVNGMFSSMNDSALKLDLATLRENIKTIYSSRRNYAGLNNQVVIDYDLMPASFKGLSGPSGSTVTISPTGSDNSFFSIELSSFKDRDMAKSTCINLIPGLDSGWDAIVINGKSYKQDSFKEAVRACNSSNRIALRGQ